MNKIKQNKYKPVKRHLIRRRSNIIYKEDTEKYDKLLDEVNQLSLDRDEFQNMLSQELDYNSELSARRDELSNELKQTKSQLEAIMKEKKEKEDRKPKKPIIRETKASLLRKKKPVVNDGKKPRGNLK